ncbi:MAG: DUF1080 domain-containing protein, partial [Opitutales bacterium]|nr:DUF1080 domain-containing protein [Opitutales bacterium]
VSILFAKAEWEPLFNGKDLSGWTATDPLKFKVEDGMIIGFQNDGKGADLRTTREFNNFELKFRYKRTEKGNSGIWFRQFYQFDLLDMIPVTSSGAFYYPKCPTTFVWKNVDESLEKKNEWNEGQIYANGNRIIFGLNGQMLGDETLDPKVHRIIKSGNIGIQVHGGDAFKGMQVFLKQIDIRTLNQGEPPSMRFYVVCEEAK